MSVVRSTAAYVGNVIMVPVYRELHFRSPGAAGQGHGYRNPSAQQQKIFPICCC